LDYCFIHLWGFYRARVVPHAARGTINFPIHAENPGPLRSFRLKRQEMVGIELGLDVQSLVLLTNMRTTE
jgi:hypothetical protein